MHAGENLHQRALAGAVFSHQRMDFAALQVEVDVLQRRRSGEEFGDPFRSENDVPGGRDAGRLLHLRSVRPHRRR